MLFQRRIFAILLNLIFLGGCSNGVLSGSRPTALEMKQRLAKMEIGNANSREELMENVTKATGLKPDNILPGEDFGTAHDETWVWDLQGGSVRLDVSKVNAGKLDQWFVRRY